MKHIKTNLLLIIFLTLSLSFFFANYALAGTATVSWNANTESDLAGYKIYYGTSPRTSSCPPGDYASSVNIGNVTSYTFPNLTNGATYYFSITAFDTSNNESCFSSEVNKIIPVPDTTAPSVSLTAPSSGSTVSGTITVSANASDNVGVVGVQFKLDGSNLGTEDTASPYSVSWNTTSSTNSSHTLTAIARDSAGNSATSASITVTVNNVVADTTPPTISSVLVSSIAYNSAVVTWTTNEPATSQVEYGTSTTYGSQTTLDISLVNSHSISLTSLSASTTYHYRVKSKDSSSNERISSDYVFITLAITPTTDTTPPSIPTNLTAVAVSSSQINLSWTTSTDNVGVTGYRIYRCTGSSCTPTTQIATPATNSYQDTGLSSSTAYTYKVAAYDAAGNVSGQSSSALATTQALSGQQLTLYPQEDTFLNINSEINVNSASLNTYTWPNNKVANAILMKFDLSSIPANATIQSASLNLYLTESDTNSSYSTYNIVLHRIINKNPDLSRATGYTYDGTNSWTANTSCYNNIPLAQADISSVYNTQSVNKTVGFKSWDATFLVTYWLNNSSLNYGLLLNSDASKPGDSYRFFASKQNSDANIRPYLTITYIPVTSDTTPPTVFLTAPSSGSTVSGTITVSATASDNVGVAGVQFKLDGANLASEDISSPYSVSWNTTSASNGSHTLTATARDSAGNSATSASVTVTVSNVVADTTPPTISSVSASSITYNSAAITWTTNEASDSQVEYGLTTSYGSQTTLNTSIVTSHPVLLSSLSASTLYHYRVKSKDAAGNLATSPDYIFTTSSTPTLSVSISANPLSGTAPLSGVDLTATISGNVLGNTNYTFYCNRSDTGTNITTPYDAKYDNLTVTSRTAADLCNYTNPGSYTAKVIVERGGYQAEARTAITVSSPSSSTKFSLNDRVQATATVNVRQTPSISGTLLGSHNSGDLGTVIGGPTYADSYWWWNIDYDNSPDGWSVENYLAKYTSPSDTTLPLISNILVSNLMAKSATIAWKTNESSDSKVNYGTAANNLDQSVFSSSLTTEHSLALNDLNRKTTYFYNVISKDSSGNQASSNFLSFKTLARLPKPPKVNNLQAQVGSVVLSWENPDYELLKEIVIFRRTDTFPQDPTTEIAYLIVTITDLSAISYTDTQTSANTTYYYSIFTIDDLGVYSDPAQISLTTLPGTIPTPATPITPTTPATPPATPPGGGTTPTPTTPTTPTVPTPPEKPLSQMSIEELQAKITEILAAIQQLQNQIAKIKGGGIAEIPATYKFTTNLKYGQKSIDVTYLQIFLKVQGTEIYPKGLVTGYFGLLTKEAVIRFQEKYAAEILSPWRLTKGTGIVGKTTIEKINQILGR